MSLQKFDHLLFSSQRYSPFGFSRNLAVLIAVAWRHERPSVPSIVNEQMGSDTESKLQESGRTGC
jgi:hypothetical protein